MSTRILRAAAAATTPPGERARVLQHIAGAAGP